MRSWIWELTVLQTSINNGYGYLNLKLLNGWKPLATMRCPYARFPVEYNEMMSRGEWSSMGHTDIHLHGTSSHCTATGHHLTIRPRDIISLYENYNGTSSHCTATVPSADIRTVSHWTTYSIYTRRPCATLRCPISRGLCGTMKCQISHGSALHWCPISCWL